MATATVTRPSTHAKAHTTAPVAATSEYTAGQKAVAAVVIGSASALTVGVFAWGAWVASQISIPV